MRKLIFIFIFFTTTCFAESAATLLVALKSVTNASGSALGRGAQLSAGDSIVTGAGALAKIKYANGTLVTLGQKSNYTILSYSPKQAENEVTAELKQGKLELKTTKKTNETLKTPTVALAIYGTGMQVFIPSSAPGATLTVNVKVTSGGVSANGVAILPNQPVAIGSDGVPVSEAFPSEGKIDETAAGDSNTATSGDSSESSGSGGDSSAAGAEDSSDDGDVSSDNTDLIQPVSSVVLGTEEDVGLEVEESMHSAEEATIDITACSP